MTAEETMTRSEIQQAALRIGAATGAGVTLDAPLAPFLSMRVGGPVAALVAPRDPASVADVVRAMRAAAVPHRVLGGGSNLLATDGPLDFAVVHVGATSAPARWGGDLVTVPAGMPLGGVLREALKAGRTGLEWAAGLPGTIGGAVAGNAGAFGSDIGRLVRSVLVLGADGRERVHAVRDGDFRYRGSFLGPDEVVLEVTLELRASDRGAVRAETDRVNRARAGSQPKGGHSAGCMFKNPVASPANPVASPANPVASPASPVASPARPAGKLIDECGLKGMRRGGASVSQAHGNFVVNDGTATASDILALIDALRAEVLRRTGVELETEVKVWR
jgi:UDP-N-acetylmuramate dehydrogenase